MLQNHSFFSSPFIFYGSNQADDEEMEEECFYDPCRIFLETNMLQQHAPRTELFFHWYSLDE